jgi:hypothetical protein
MTVKLILKDPSVDAQPEAAVLCSAAATSLLALLRMDPEGGRGSSQHVFCVAG